MIYISKLFVVKSDFLSTIYRHDKKKEKEKIISAIN